MGPDTFTWTFKRPLTSSTVSVTDVLELGVSVHFTPQVKGVFGVRDFPSIRLVRPGLRPPRGPLTFTSRGTGLYESRPRKTLPVPGVGCPVLPPSVPSPLHLPKSHLRPLSQQPYLNPPLPFSPETLCGPTHRTQRFFYLWVTDVTLSNLLPDPPRSSSHT